MRYEQFIPVCESFRRLAELCDDATRGDDYAELIERWRSLPLFVLEVSREQAFDRDCQRMARVGAQEPPSEAFYELFEDILLRGEYDGRVIYIPDATGWDDLHQFLWHNDHAIKPPQDIVLARDGWTLIASEWNHRCAILAIQRSGQFSSL